MFSTPGETPDHLTVWIRHTKPRSLATIIPASASRSRIPFPNIYAIRGTKPRWALDWIKSLDTVLALKPEIVLNGHGDPIVATRKSLAALKRYRDAIQYVHDEPWKGMNAGKDVFTLCRRSSCRRATT